MSRELWAVCEKCDGTSWKDGCSHGAFDVVKHVTDCGSRKVWPCPPFVEADFDAIWTRYYVAAGRNRFPGLTYDELWEVVYGE